MKTESSKSAGRRGGLETLKKHGKDHFSKIAKEMWKKRKGSVRVLSRDEEAAERLENGFTISETK